MRDRYRADSRPGSGRSALVTSILVAAVVTAAGTGASAAPAPDPLRVSQWGLCQIRAEAAWSVTRGEGAVIAVVDSGVDMTHADLFTGAADDPEVNAKFVAGNSFLDCGARGCGDGHWRHPTRDTTVTATPQGTHVAGIAAATAGNGVGIAGVAPAARILPVRVSILGRDVAAGVRWAADQKADVINLGLPRSPVNEVLALADLDSGISDAISYATSQGAVVVAAAGDAAEPFCASPALRGGLVCVAATLQDEQRAPYSNFPLSLDLAAVSAPGGQGGDCGAGVLSTMPIGQGRERCGYPVSGEYAEGSGTAAATAHVSGVAALLVSLGCDRAAVVDLLTSTARTPGLGERGTWTPTHGYGIVDAEAATAAAADRC